MANAFPLLLLGGSSETYWLTKGAFQEMDAISYLSPHTKHTIRPPTVQLIPQLIQGAYRKAWYGRPGASFVDLPADLIQSRPSSVDDITLAQPLPDPPVGGANDARLLEVAELLKGAKAPLVVIGKGAAYAQAESVVRELIDRSHVPFLPSPTGKGVVPDSHPANASSARSAALLQADVILVLGARLNWILHYGQAPKWNPNARIIQVDISADEIGHNRGDSSLGIVGDINIVVPQLLKHLSGWRFDTASSPYCAVLASAADKNEQKATAAAEKASLPLSFARAFFTIKSVLDRLSPPSDGGIVYVSEGSNTMDISRSIFQLSHPRLRLDAGTYATMGLGPAYAIAAHEAYNGVASEAASGPSKRKKIIALEGDSAFGFSAMEVETMVRCGMDVLIFVMNNSGIYHGDSDSKEEWLGRQKHTVAGKGGPEALRSWSLGWEVKYEQVAEMCGGRGFFVRTIQELEEATQEGFRARVPVVVNVIIESGKRDQGKAVSSYLVSYIRYLLITISGVFLASWETRGGFECKAVRRSSKHTWFAIKVRPDLAQFEYELNGIIGLPNAVGDEELFGSFHTQRETSTPISKMSICFVKTSESEWALMGTPRSS